MAGEANYFSEVQLEGAPLWKRLAAREPITDYQTLLAALRYVHLAHGLLAAYHKDYPLVESRELVPSFDAPLIEYKELPAFSMVVLDRAVNYMDEGFQFDWLKEDLDRGESAQPATNRNILRDRLPRNLLKDLETAVGRRPVTPLSQYPALFPLLIKMDRGHLIARDGEGGFHLAGIYASFPSDLDGEIKRMGRQMGKFQKGDNESYAANRLFVYRFLMEQTGFPICGERHTSAALFARRLYRRKEDFCVKVMGQSDRVVTSMSSGHSDHSLPRVTKAALVAVISQDESVINALAEGGFFVDQERRVVLLQVAYARHRYHPDNVLEERALSVEWQRVIHPQTGQSIDELDILGLGSHRLLLLNDIVRGECLGSIVYRGRERISGTKETENRLKFLAAWLGKHRHIVADYSPDSFDQVRKVLGSYLDDPEKQEDLAKYPELVKEVRAAMTDVWVAHRLRLLEKLVSNRTDHSGRKLAHAQVITILAHILAQEGARIARDHPRSFKKLLGLCHRQLNNRYLKKRYLSSPAGTTRERQVVSEYKLLEVLVERFEKLA